MIPTINKPTRVTRKTVTAIDHIFTNSFCDTVFKTVIYKCDVSDHFPICFIIPSPSKQENVTETTFITKRILNTKSTELFKKKLYETSWDEMEMSQNPEIGPKLAKNIQKYSINCESFMKTCDNTQVESALTINELKDAFFSLQINKSPGYDEINFNVVRNCFGLLLKPLMFIFNLSLQKGSFPDELKVAKVTPVFKADDVNELGNYRPISVLSCFSKILERIMYNRLSKYLKTNEILYKKQFGFQEGHSTEHAIIQLIDQMNNCFEKKSFYPWYIYRSQKSI